MIIYYLWLLCYIAVFGFYSEKEENVDGVGGPLLYASVGRGVSLHPHTAHHTQRFETRQHALERKYEDEDRRLRFGYSGSIQGGEENVSQFY